MTHETLAPAPLLVDPGSLVEDAHATLGALRAGHALIRLGEAQYMALRAEHVLPLLTDPRTAQIDGEAYLRLTRVPEGAVARFLADFLLFREGAAHRARRGLFARGFAHSAMRAARPRIRARAEAIVAGLPRGESFDFIAQVSGRLPAEMIADILGLPESEVPYFAARAREMARAVSPLYPLGRHARIEEAVADMFHYIEHKLSARLAAPREDMLSAAATEWQARGEISFASLVHQVMGLVVGGVDTTRAGFAMLVALLLARPDDWAALRAAPELIPGAVSEGLRYDPPVGSVARVTTAELEVGGHRLPAGVVLRVSTLSALRDPALFAEPERFDIRRPDHARLHPVFGTGPHRCIGEMLARIEMEESLAALLEGAPGMVTETAPRMRGFGGIREITPMTVRIR
ncbi:cytochrome P450 [Oceanicella sp. SM1341]|uniref:cytochrome P450 n=1 Tax=Oceanicella sp. SM1341 TaxID=1548889 RepID=UPI001300A18D|nr:cytochrome P450 [Oceanicella sp. SM1341]